MNNSKTTLSDLLIKVVWAESTWNGIICLKIPPLLSIELETSSMITITPWRNGSLTLRVSSQRFRETVTLCSRAGVKRQQEISDYRSHYYFPVIRESQKWKKSVRMFKANAPFENVIAQNCQNPLKSLAVPLCSVGQTQTHTIQVTAMATAWEMRLLECLLSVSLYIVPGYFFHGKCWEGISPPALLLAPPAYTGWPKKGKTLSRIIIKSY